MQKKHDGGVGRWAGEFADERGAATRELDLAPGREVRLEFVGAGAFVGGDEAQGSSTLMITTLNS